MDVLKLTILLAIIVLVMKFKKPIYIAIAAAILGASLLYQIGPIETIKIMGRSLVSWGTISLLLAFYSITFLQRMLEKRNYLILAEESLSRLFNNRRLNAMVAPFIIGLLPAVNAVIIAAPMVDNACGEYVSKEDKTFIASYYRHISESFLPTYSSILLALNLSGVDMTAFVLGMLPMVALLFLLGYIFYVRKIPRETDVPGSEDKRQDVKNLFKSLWTIALTIAIILVLKIPVYTATLPVILLFIIIDKFTAKEIRPMFMAAIEKKLMLSTVVIMMFKDVLAYAGVIERLPAQFASLPVPAVVVFALIFLFGTIVAGATAMIALSLPLAFASIPMGGLPLLILLISLSYISMQISPTHICLAVATEEFETSMLDLVKRTMPIWAIFTVAASIYSYLLSLLI